MTLNDTALKPAKSLILKILDFPLLSQYVYLQTKLRFWYKYFNYIISNTSETKLQN